MYTVSRASSGFVRGLFVFLPCFQAIAAEPGVTNAPAVAETREDAWWTGPLLASSASTLPQGHLLIEPYLYDSVLIGHFASDKHRSAESHEATVGTLSYFIYGVTDRVSVGVIPRFASRDAPGPGGSAGFGAGDVSLQAQYRVTQFTEEHQIPTISVIAIETLPSGKYDRLDTNSGAGLGAGAFTTTVALYSQYYFWLPTGRILRSRLNIGYSWSSTVAIMGNSVYGTPVGFDGMARPGESATFDAAFEYSATRNWVVAMDILGERDSNTHTLGYVATGLSRRYVADSRPSDVLVFAPALEFNWNANLGVIVGARVVGLGRNAAQTIAGVVALNMVF